MNHTFFRIFLLLLFLAVAPKKSFGQFETRIWNSYSAVLPLQKDLSVRGTYMKSLDISDSPVQTSFNWYSIQLQIQQRLEF